MATLFTTCFDRPVFAHSDLAAEAGKNTKLRVTRLLPLLGVLSGVRRLNGHEWAAQSHREDLLSDYAQ